MIDQEGRPSKRQSDRFLLALFQTGLLTYLENNSFERNLPAGQEHSLFILENI